MIHYVGLDVSQKITAICAVDAQGQGVGAIVAITFRSGVDDPARFRRSRHVGPHFRLTPRKYR